MSRKRYSAGGKDIAVRQVAEHVYVRISCVAGKAPTLSFYRHSFDAARGEGPQITRWRLPLIREIALALEKLELDEFTGMPPRSVADLMDNDDDMEGDKQ